MIFYLRALHEMPYFKTTAAIAPAGFGLNLKEGQIPMASLKLRLILTLMLLTCAPVATGTGRTSGASSEQAH